MNQISSGDTWKLLLTALSAAILRMKIKLNSWQRKKVF